jgi:hypothetical protein
VLGGILAVSAFFLAKKYEPEVKDAIIYELNQYLKAPVDVEDINFSLLQRFPYASLRFSNVVIPEVGGEASDTLLFVSDLYLQIGLINFFKKDYKISEAEVNRGFFHMRFFKDGSENFRFWKSSGDSSRGTFSLTNIEFRNFKYRLDNQGELVFDAHINDGGAEGNFGSELFDLKADLDLKVNSVIFENNALYESTNVAGKIALTINTRSQVYSFETDKIRIGTQSASLKGKYDNSTKKSFWNVDLAADRADLEGVVELIPSSNRQVFETYIPTGKSNIALNINTSDGFSLRAEFDELKGEVSHVESAGRAEIYSGKGALHIHNGESKLRIDGLQAGIGPGRFTSSGSISNIEAPTFDLNLEGRLDLSELKDFLNISFAEVLEGKIDLKGNLNGKLTEQQIKADRYLEGVNFLGEIVLTNGAIKTVGRKQALENIEGSFEIVDNAIESNRLVARTGDTEFEISGKINNALPYLSGYGGRLKIEADLKSDKVYLEQIIGDAANTKSTMAFKLPDNIGFNLNIFLKEVAYKSFRAEEVSGMAYYQNGLLTLNPVKMKIASGGIVGSLRVRQSTDFFELRCSADMNDMQVNQLFANFDDFGQKVISAGQIEGKLEGEVELSCTLDSNLTILKNSVVSDVGIRIDDGRLKEVESIVNIASYIEDNSVWKSFVKTDILKERLTNIEFETLENQLSIKNGMVTIPEMSISTSVLNLAASGTHDFDNNIDYNIRFRLGELLRTGREKESEFGYVVDDGTGLNLFLKMSGTVENPQFSMDKSTARDTRKAKFESEKKVVKGILKEEFGLFKKDTTLIAPELKPSDEPTILFEVEFGDSLSTDSVITDKKKKLSKKDRELYEELEDDDDM